MEDETTLFRPPTRARPYPWERLRRLSAAEARAANDLVALAPHLAAHDLHQGIRELVHELAELDTELSFHGVAIHPRGLWDVELGDAFVTTFHLPSAPQPGLLAIGAELASRCIGALLRDEAAGERLVAFDERDFGLMTYLLLRIVEIMSAAGLPPVVLPTAPPNVERLRRDVLAPYAQIEAIFVARTASTRGFVRAFFPAPTLAGLRRVVEDDPRPTSLATRAVACAAGDVVLAMPVSIARVRVRFSELSELGPGDLVLPTEAVELGLDTPAGAGRVFVAGQSFFEARVEAGEGRWQIFVDDLITKHERTMTQQPSGEDFASDTTRLLDQAEVTLEVRIGSLAMSVRDLAQLQVGQVLTVDRAVGEPVELSANGRVVALGELVDVEGRLGVRVTSLTRSDPTT